MLNRLRQRNLVGCGCLLKVLHELSSRLLVLQEGALSNFRAECERLGVLQSRRRLLSWLWRHFILSTCVHVVIVIHIINRVLK